MRRTKTSLLSLVCLGLIALMAGCGSTSTGSTGGGTGTFTLGAEAAVTIAQGSTRTFTVTPASSNNFTGSVQVSVTGLPTGVTVTPAVAMVAVGSSTTFTLTAAANAVVGTTNVKVYGASGDLSTNATVALTVTATTNPPGSQDFTLTAAPQTLSLTPGAAGQVTLSSAAINGFSGTIAVAVKGLPTGVTVSPATISLTSTNPVSITLTAADDAPATTTPVQVSFVGTSGTLSHTATLQLTVAGTTPPVNPDFTLTLAPQTLSLTPGAAGQVTLSSTAIDGFNGTITVAMQGLPTGVTVSPTPLSLTPGNPLVITLSAANDASATTTPVQVSFVGTSGTLSHTATLQLTVAGTTPPVNPDFTLMVAPQTLSLTPGTNGQVTLSSAAINGFSGTIAVAVQGLPTGVTMSPTTISLTSGNPLVITLTAAADAPATTTPVQVSFVGTSGTLSHTATLQLTVVGTTPPVNPDFTFTVAPQTLSLTPGANGQVTLNSTALNGFSGTITVAVQGLPTGVTVSPTTLSLTSGNPLVVTLTAAVDAPATTTPVQVSFVGTSGTLSHTATLQLTVNSVGPTGPDFTIAAAPNAITVAQGAESDPVNIGVTGINGFSGNVTFAVSGLPAGVTVIPSQGTLESGWMDPVVFVVAADATIGTATVTITGTSGVLTHTATLALTVSGPAPLDFVSLTLSPTSETVTTGSIGTVSVTATATQGYTGPVNVSATNLPTGITVSPAATVLTPGVAQTFTVIAAANATPGSYTVTFLGQVNSVNGSAPLALTVVNPTNTGLDVPTWHYDIGRTGLDAQETSLTPTAVAATFGKRSVLAMDGAVDAQPLYLSGMTIGAQTHNVLYVATENDSVYAMDASSGAQLWKTSALQTSETAADNQGCNELSSQVGITSTPVIDRYFGPDGAIYFVAKTKDSGGNYHQRLHALDLTTGAELAGSPVEITATYPANGGVTQTFDPGIFVERSALLLSQGTVYLSWGAPCQQTSFDYDGWVMAYGEATLAQQSVLDLTPNGSGGGIWMSGAGPAADQFGSVFLITSNGTFDTTLGSNGGPVNSDYGNGYVQIQSSNGVMSVFDYFEPLNGVPGSANYQDQGSGGIVLIPDIQEGGPTLSLAAGAGKDGNIYELSRLGGSMGEYDGQNDSNFYTLSNALPNGASSTPATIEGILYYGGNGDSLKAFVVLGFSSFPASEATNTLGPAGATPVISTKSDMSTPIVWTLDTTASGGPALYAYDAMNLSSQLYSSSAKSGDAVGATSAHAVPLVANGSVYIGTETGITIFGLQ